MLYHLANKNSYFLERLSWMLLIAILESQLEMFLPQGRFFIY